MHLSGQQDGHGWIIERTPEPVPLHEVAVINFSFLSHSRSCWEQSPKVLLKHWRNSRNSHFEDVTGKKPSWCVFSECLSPFTPPWNWACPRCTSCCWDTGEIISSYCAACFISVFIYWESRRRAGEYAQLTVNEVTVLLAAPQCTCPAEEGGGGRYIWDFLSVNDWLHSNMSPNTTVWLTRFVL